MSIRLKQLLPVSSRYPKSETANAQGRIRKSLFDRADKIRLNNGWTWNAIISALFEKFCDEFENENANYKPKKFQLQKMELIPPETASREAKFGSRM